MPTAPTASVLSETRIGLFEISGATRTELSAAVSDRSQWACGSPSREIARVSSDPGIDEPLAMQKAGSLSYFSVDGLGSVVATNDPSGTVTYSVVFDAWGNVKAETGTRTHPFTYTGREVGEAGLHFYRARFYQPGIGRFTQEDPLDLAPTVHPYRYPSNSPTIYLDPLGLWDWVRDGLEPLSDFSAGFGDSLTFGGTRKIRQMMGIDGVVNHCSPAYKTGEYTEVATEIALTGGSAALRRAAANTSRVAVRNAFKRATRSIARNGGKMHHVNPLFGHPGGTRALFPTAGLPSGLAHHRLNLALLGAAEHTAAHRRLRALERLAATAVNPGTTTGRAARNSSDDCGCP